MAVVPGGSTAMISAPSRIPRSVGTHSRHGMPKSPAMIQSAGLSTGVK